MFVSSGLLLSIEAARKNLTRFPLCLHFYLWIADKWGKRDYVNKFSVSDSQAHIPNRALLLLVCSASCKTKTMTTDATCFNCFFFSFSSGINIKVPLASWTFFRQYYIKSNDSIKIFLSARKSIVQVFLVEFTGFIWFERRKSVMGRRNELWVLGWRWKHEIL